LPSLPQTPLPYTVRFVSAAFFFCYPKTLLEELPYSPSLYGKADLLFRLILNWRVSSVLTYISPSRFLGTVFSFPPSTCGLPHESAPMRIFRLPSFPGMFGLHSTSRRGLSEGQRSLFSSRSFHLWRLKPMLESHSRWP